MRRAQRTTDVGEPDLIPVMNLVCLLIPFLLMTTAFVQYAVVSVLAPSFVPHQREIQTEPRLELTVLVTDEGFTLSAAGRRLGPATGLDATASAGPTIPMARPEGRLEYDYATLSARLRLIKDENEDESRINIGAERNIDYETVVRVMDATRDDAMGELFPDVVLLAGVI